MLADPGSAEAEPFRVLRTNFEFFNVEHGARTVMVTSAHEKEGKSTTLANLAVTLARAGRRVTVVDLDLRRPSLERLFRLKPGPGVTEVARGRAKLSTALTHVPIAEDDADTDADGTLHVLGAGAIPADVAEFIAGKPLANLLRALRRRGDIVLIDAPPLLGTGDAMALSARVDALVVVTRLHALRRPLLGELRRVLDTCPTRKLGFVLTGAQDEDDLDTDYDYQRVPGGELERVT